MIGRPSNASHNRWISPRQVQILQTLWSVKLRRAGRRLRPERSREERLRLIAEIVGHAVASSKELSWREANRVIHRLLEEIRSAALSPAAAVPATSLPLASFDSAPFDSAQGRQDKPLRAGGTGAAGPEAGAETEGQAPVASPGGPPPDLSTRAVASEEGSGPQALPDQGVEGQGGPSDAQLWKIRQIEQYLGWGQPGKNEKRLAGFLRAKFHVARPEELAHDQAWRAIEALCAAGARARIKARKGQAYRVKHEELTRAVAALKQELEEWRPTQP